MVKKAETNNYYNKALDHIQIRGAKVHNLKNIDIDIPLNQLVAIAGVSGSGKSSLALGVLYAEGSRRYLDAMSTYTRHRIAQTSRAQIEDIRHVPAALALRQRPGIPGIRSTFGTSTELLSTLRLMFSRLANHKCPNGHPLLPSMDIAAEKELICPECGIHFFAPSAEDFSFNSTGACQVCNGTGIIRVVDESTLVPDESLTIDEGAVLPWQTLMWSLMKDVAREMGVRTNVPFNQLTETERDIVFHGPAEKRHIMYYNKKGNSAGELDFTYYNAVYTVENALSKVKDEKSMKRVEKFLRQGHCPNCHGSRLNKAARTPTILGESLDQVCQKPLGELIQWVSLIPGSMPKPMIPMAEAICEEFLNTAQRLTDLGLSYLTLDRATSTLSTGERQRTQLARAVRNCTIGVLYVLDEPSIGLHPSNIVGLVNVMKDLVSDGNSVVFVDHDTQVLVHADWLIELGPKAGAGGGKILSQGTIEDIISNKTSMIGPFLLPGNDSRIRPVVKKNNLFDFGSIEMSTSQIHTVKPLTVCFPKGRLSVVTGVSGSGKTTMVLESLIPGLEAYFHNKKLPNHVHSVHAGGIQQIKLIDASPIGNNVRSTVATYTGIHDELRKIYSKTLSAKNHGWKASDFSYNTGNLRCPSCDGTGTISLDVQFLPDMDIPCPDCRGSRYRPEASKILLECKNGNRHTLPDLMAMSITEASDACAGFKNIFPRLQVLQNLGLGYLALGEDTPSLSGGESQRLKLASEIGRAQDSSIFVFDEPTIGLHPLDVQTLLQVFQKLIDQGATIIVIEHDLDVIRNADYIVDMGPGGGEAGGQIVAVGTVEEIKQNPRSITGHFL